ncbi:MAG: sugar phosphate isomerase/epimerase [Clostridiales bacterium]|nr:sugar phosphate isomerase/epimerase [Clostridiales bacterium]
MRVATSTEMCGPVLRGTERYYSLEEAADAIVSAGYQAIDINFPMYEEELSEDNWREWAEKEREYIASMGLPIVQGHAHLYGSFDFYEYTQEQIEFHAGKILRDIEAAGIFGIPWLVVHPDSYLDETWYSRKRSMEKNVERFLRYGEAAERFGVGIAIENMIDKRSLRRFGAGTEDLLELLDRLGDDARFGICWDTGHANLHQMNQVRALHEVGSCLKAVHINDNDGVYDKHPLPYQGTVEWKAVVGALKDIGYTGDFTYEVHGFSRGYDPGFHQEAMRYARRLGEFLVTL